MLGIDLLVHLQSQALSLQGLAGLAGPEDEVRELLAVLVQQGLVADDPGGFSGAMDPMYTITAKGRETCGAILDRYAVELAGPMTMSVGERFVLAVADRIRLDDAVHIATLLDLVPDERSDATRRADALTLTRSAVEYAQRALDADEDGRRSAAIGLTSLSIVNEEDAGYTGGRLREYSETVANPLLKRVVGDAAATCEFAWNLRPLGPKDPKTNISLERPIDERVFFELADQAAATLWALVDARQTATIPEVEAVISQLRPNP